jgi:serine/threonine-protein kinase
MGEVYLGERDGRRAAVKILPEDLARDADFRARFERESWMLEAFSHPNIVKVQEAGESHGVYYMVLDYIEGRELSALLDDRVRIPLEEVRPLLKDFAAALDYAHDRGLVHRDIQPRNITIRRRSDGVPEAVLLDFGVAKFLDGRTMATNTGAIGTISCMAPEQILAAKSVDHRADIYALGVTTYEILTGELPFKGNPAQVLFAHLQQPPVDPSILVPDLPPVVGRSVLRALEKKPEDRFQSAGAFAAALDDAS